MSELAGIALALNQDGRLAVVVTAHEGGDAGTVWHYQPSSGWTPLGQPSGGTWPDAGPAVAGNADGRLEAVAVGRDLAVWHAWQAYAGGDWTGWHSLELPGGKEIISKPFGARPPGPTPALASNADGRLEVFVVREDLTVWHRWQRGEGGWSAWASLRRPGDGTMGPLAVGADADGRLELFANDPDGAVWHAWQTAPNNGWSGWHSLGTPGGQPAISAPALAQNEDGRLELFTVAGDGAVWHAWQTAPNNGWSGWHSLGSQGRLGFAEVGVGANDDGCLVLFATDQENGTDLWQREQATPGGDWSPWLSRASLLEFVPGSIADPTLTLNADRRLELFLRVSRTGDMCRLVQLMGPSGGSWSSALIEFPAPN
jgi:hypothetical protein